MIKFKPSLFPCVFGLLVVILSAGCEDTVEELSPTVTALERYYPLELNRPTFYQVDSIVLSNTVGGIRYDTSMLEVRETLVETFVGADGATLFRGERWEKPEGAQNFSFKQTFTVDRDNRSVTRNEDNLGFIKLVAPIRRGEEWDGNIGFDEDRSIAVGGEFLDVYRYWEYHYSNVDTSLTLRTGVSLDSVVVVTQAEETDNLIELRRAYEYYAPGIGLVERFIDARHTQYIVCCNRDPALGIDLSWDEKAEKGYIIRQTFLRQE